MGLFSRNKGKRAELAFSKLCREHGYDTRRGQQYCGVNGDADVVGLSGIHIEVKAVEHLNIHDAIAQSVRDAKTDEIPIVAHKKNHTGWLITCRAEDWFKLYREWEAGNHVKI